MRDRSLRRFGRFVFVVCVSLSLSLSLCLSVSPSSHSFIHVSIHSFTHSTFSPFTQLIDRHVRELKVETALLPLSSSSDIVAAKNFKYVHDTIYTHN